MKKSIIVLATIISSSLQAQLYIERGGEMQVDKGASIHVQGDLDANENISGEGTVILEGTALQVINMHGNYLPNLTIINGGGVHMTGIMKVAGDLSLSGSLLQLDGYALELSSSSIVHATDGAGIVTNRGGLVRKLVDSDLSSYHLPLVAGKQAAPLVLNSSGRYLSAFVEVVAVDEAAPNKPADALEYIQQHWKINRQGINGDLNIEASYIAPSEAGSLQGYIYADRKWKEAVSSNAKKFCAISVAVPERRSEIFAMNPFRLKNSLSPNPAATITRLLFHTNSDTRGQLMISDSRGRLVQVRTVTFMKGINQININIANLTNGYYDVTVLNSGKKSTFRLVKQ